MEEQIIPYQAVREILAQSVLALAPHPDDEIFGCGGTLVRHVEAGVPVHVIVATDGSFCSEAVERFMLISKREAESCSAAAILGIPTPEFWRLPDRGLCYSEALVERIVLAIRAVGADLVFAPSTYEAHPDHSALSMAAIEAVRRIGIAVRLALYEVGVPLRPNTLVDISDLVEKKRAAMRCFASQLAHQRYDEQIEALNRFRAYTLPKEIIAAEAFEVITAEDIARNFLSVFLSEHQRRRTRGATTIGTTDLPLVSIIVRSMDRPTLGDALDSIALQTYPNIEVVVVNASGGTHRALGEFCGRHPIRFTNFNGPSLRRSAAANIGLAAAQGEFINFLDDDDWLEPIHIAALVSKLNSHPEAVAAYAGVRCIRKSEDSEKIVKVFNHPFDDTHLLIENFIPLHALIFRSNARYGDSACRFDEKFDLFEDWDFWLQLLTHGSFIHIETISAVYRIHEGGGEGVQADEKLSIAALDQLLAKWRSRWTAEQLRNLIARSRLLNGLLNEHRALLEQRGREMAIKEATISSMETTISTMETTISSMETTISTMETTISTKEATISSMETTISSMETIIAELTAWRESIEKTLFYRIVYKTAVLRRKLGTARRLFFEGRIREIVWLLLVNLYACPAARPLIMLVPFSIKRTLRNYFSRTLRSSEMTAFSGKLSEHPTVSILIPVYQHAEYIDRCIRSALNQDYGNLEIIVIEDASPDPQVGLILKELEGKPRLTILRNNENLGISRSQNRALLASSGEIIGFLDCDDFLEPNAVTVSLRYWKPDTVYSHSARVNIDAQGKEVNRVCFRHLPRSDYFAENLEAMFATHFKMIRRDIFARLGLFDPRFDTAQDYDFLMRVAAHYPSSAFAYVPHFIYNHRLHDNQTTEIANQRQGAAVAQIKQEAILRRKIQQGYFEKSLSFIMLSFGKHSQTLEALRSLQATVKVPHEIILFDNGSDAETVAFIRDNIEGRFSNLKVFYSDRNLGPATGRREALQHASGDWFIIFDNDEIAEPGWLEELLVRASSDPQIGIVTCKVIFPNRAIQCCGGYIENHEEDIVELHLHSSGMDAYDLASAQFLDCDWCPIGATLFTVNPSPFMHAGYPNVFEDVGVSMALHKLGYRLANSPASWVWHEHVTFRKKVEMGARYNRERYDPRRMLVSIASYYYENGKILYDTYVWRENQLDRQNLPSVRRLLVEVARETYPSKNL